MIQVHSVDDRKACSRLAGAEVNCLRRMADRRSWALADPFIYIGLAARPRNSWMPPRPAHNIPVAPLAVPCPDPLLPPPGVLAVDAGSTPGFPLDSPLAVCTLGDIHPRSRGRTLEHLESTSTQVSSQFVARLVREAAAQSGVRARYTPVAAARVC